VLHHEFGGPANGFFSYNKNGAMDMLRLSTRHNGMLRSLLAAAFSLVMVTAAQAQMFCVFDPEGAQGEGMAAMKDAQLVARRWGVNLQFRVYTDETVAVEDFKAGQCDGINMTGLRARQFNQFTGTIDSPGTIEDYAEMHDVINLVASPKLARLMISGPYEVVGVIPLGGGYPFMRDRNINTLAKAAGKKIAVMDWDRTQAMLVEQIGAQPVMSDLTSYGGKFNNGAVDIIIAPIILYKPFELYKGIGTQGGIVRRAVIQLTTQLIIRRDKFPDDFGQRCREYVASQGDRAFGYIRNQENQVEQRQWMYATTAQRDEYIKLMHGARLHLVQAGFYDKRMLSILKRVRCKHKPDDAECTLTDE
jgi:hypothetical protein